MPKCMPEEKRLEIRQRTMLAAARLFLERGYTDTTVREIAQAAGVHVNAMIRVVGSKEDILCTLVGYVLDGQFSAADQMLAGVTDDPVLYYAAETTLQLYMAESDEAVRNLYAAAYSMAESSQLIYRAIAGKLQKLFATYLPGLDFQDFYELEISSGGAIRGHMAIPCGGEYTMERKVRRFLETSLRMYQIPEDTIQRAVTFVGQFDYPTIARMTIRGMLAQLEQAQPLGMQEIDA